MHRSGLAFGDIDRTVRQLRRRGRLLQLLGGDRPCLEQRLAARELFLGLREFLAAAAHL